MESRMQARSSLVVVVVAGLALCGCDLFGQVRCDKDSDCPDDTPFCNSNVCGKTADDGRDGRGVGEGEGEGEGGGGACSSDDACAPGLCYTASDGAAPVNTCVPLAGDDSSCPEAAIVSAGRQGGGPVAFKATAQFSGGDCSPGTSNVNFDVHYFDSEGDSLPSSLQAFAMVQGESSPTPTGGGSVEGDGTSGDAFLFYRNCVSESATYLVISLGETSPESNALCVPIAAAP
jgi:hypothetical protein